MIFREGNLYGRQHQWKMTKIAGNEQNLIIDRGQSNFRIFKKMENSLLHEDDLNE
jgi:hypothetical protein